MGAFTPYKRAEPNGKKDFLFSHGKSSANEKPVYLKLSIPLMDSVYHSPANFLFYKRALSWLQGSACGLQTCSPHSTPPPTKDLLILNQSIFLLKNEPAVYLFQVKMGHNRDEGDGQTTVRKCIWSRILA